MFGLEDSRRYYICQHYVRMNLGINGDVFIFFGKNRQMVKLLCWDGDGFLLYQKRLEKGTFELPRFKVGLKATEIPYRTPLKCLTG